MNHLDMSIRQCMVRVKNQTSWNYTSALGPQQMVVARGRYFFTNLRWERWISIIGGAGTAFPCVQLNSNYYEKVVLSESCRRQVVFCQSCRDAVIEF